MNPTVFAMRRPVTTLMMVVALISGGALAYSRMRVDIFPSLNTPKIYVFLDYIGMSPDQMEGFIVNQLELYFQYVDGIQDINTRNIQQVALCELSFFPGTDMGQAMAQVVAMSDRAMSWMPKGTLPPMIMRMDSGSVPVGYLVFESKETSIGMLGDYAQNVIRPLVQKHVPGTVAISPFGPNMRSVVVNVDPQKLLTYNLDPQQVIDALARGNTIIPAGNIYVKDSMPVVANNSTVDDVQRLGDIPLKVGVNVYLRDVATIQDDTDITYGYALVNGKKSVYLPIIKKDTGSTLTVVADVHKAMQRFREAVPKDVSVNFEFDESPTVVAAVESVATEGLIGACLTGLMILLFLRDWRSVVVVVSNIPLALLGSLFGLWVTGNTINIMSLGGMALAIGILVDESTVTVECIHVQMQRTHNIASAVLHGSLITAVPRLLALLCILSVFIPAFIMGDPLRSLFMPLTLGVGFAMISSYVLSSTFVPIMSVKLLKHMGHHDESAGLFGKILKVYGAFVRSFVKLRWLIVPGYLAACAAVLAILGPQIGTELFPQIDSGQFVLRFRPPPGSNYELTRQMAVKCLEEIEKEAKPENIAITMGFVGQVAPNFGIDNMVLFMRGPDDGQLRVALHEDSGIKLAEFRERLRRILPERLTPWLTDRLVQGGLSKEDAFAQAKLATYGFEPGDIVTNVMSFGSPMPIAVRITGTDLKLVRQYAEKVAAEMRKIPHLRDVQFQQELDYPSIEVEIDREKAGLSGAEVEDVKHALVMATSSTRFTNLNYWIDVKTGFDYLVQIQIPPLRMEKAEDIETLPLKSVNPYVNLMLRDVATVRKGVRPGELDRDMSQRYVTLVANVEGEDMGRASNQVAETHDRAHERLDVHGRVGEVEDDGDAGEHARHRADRDKRQAGRLEVGRQEHEDHEDGHGEPHAKGRKHRLHGGKLAHRLDLDPARSFTGPRDRLGVSVSNSVMLVTFMDEHWKGGSRSTEAAIVGASERLRPILMTACAMTVGMVPMALALERGSQMQAPLGLAVIGGLVMSTFATLLVLPSIFAVVIGRRTAASPSIYPDDRESANYDPNVFAHEDHVEVPVHAEEVAEPGAEAAAYEVVRTHTDDEIIGFLRSMLREIRSKRKDMITHHSVEELSDTLGFAKGSKPNPTALSPDEAQLPDAESKDRGEH
jgi:multidrug efflux pump subunit AcrB